MSTTEMSHRQTRNEEMSQPIQQPPLEQPAGEIGMMAIDNGLTLRRLVAQPAGTSRGTVLLLHGFPETLLAWQKIVPALATDHEVHAFDWPGFGLSTRPPVDQFAYAPRDYAGVLKAYIAASGIDRSTLTIYATDIGALPALLLALEEPQTARSIIVGDFAPFDRPDHMSENLRKLKAAPSAGAVRDFMNTHRDELLAGIFWRGLPATAQYDIAGAFRDDMARSWSQNGMTVVDAFAQYYSHFTRDQDYFEAHLARLKTKVTVVWGEEDPFIRREMGIELAVRIGTEVKLLPGIGHYPHLQAPDQAVAEIRAAMG